MLKYFLILGAFFLSVSAFGQTKKYCNCPKNDHTDTKVETTFNLSNGKKISLCGYKNVGSNPVTYSEFVLSVCGEKNIIDFWGARISCTLRVKKDTLLVNQINYFPIGNNFKSEAVIWLTDKIYFVSGKVVKKWEVNRQIKKYTPKEINTVLKAYEVAKYGLDDHKMTIANQLFIAAISGSKTGRKYFKEFAYKFGVLDGAFKEDYSDLAEMLEMWDQKSYNPE
jgi:hypothetical protein